MQSVALLRTSTGLNNLDFTANCIKFSVNIFPISAPVCVFQCAPTLGTFNLRMLWPKRIAMAITAVVALVCRIMSVPLTGTLRSSRTFSV